MTVPGKIVVRWVNLFSRYYGFPYKFSAGTGRLVFAPSAVFKLMLSLVVINLPAIMFILLVEARGEISDFGAVQKRIGYTSMDTIITFLANIIISVTAIVILILFWRKAEDVSEVICRLGKLDFPPTAEFETRSVKFLTRQILCMLSLVSVTCVVITIYGYVFAVETVGPVISDDPKVTLISVLNVASMPMMIIAAYVNPTISGLIMLVSFILALLAESLEILGELLATSPITQVAVVSNQQPKEKPKQLLKSVVDLGFDICDIVDSANLALESILLVLFTLFLTLLICLSYNTLTNFFYEFTYYKVWQTTIYVMISITSYKSLSFLCQCGQLVEDNMAKARKALVQRLRDMRHPGLAEHMGLLSKTLNMPGPISPYSMFSVNNSSLLAALATIVTYLIVLIQFKTTSE